jgi:hypothetical protein
MPTAARLKPPPLPPYPIRSEATVASCLFLTTPEPPLTEVRSSIEASRSHCAASIAIEFQSARCSRAGPNSNRAPDHRQDRARCPQSCCRAPIASPSASLSGAHRAMLVGHHRVATRLRLHRSRVVPPGARALLPLTAAPPSSSTVSHRRRCFAWSRPPPLTFSSLPCSHPERCLPLSKHRRCRVPPCHGRCPGEAASSHHLCAPRPLHVPCTSTWPSACACAARSAGRGLPEKKVAFMFYTCPFFKLENS